VGNGADAAYGVFNHASAPTMTESTVGASGAPTSVGILNNADGDSYTVTIDRSKILGGTNTIVNDAEFTTRVGISQLSGGAVSGGGSVKCAGAYDENYDVLNVSCG
jgi:hypothetical protein